MLHLRLISIRIMYPIFKHVVVISILYVLVYSSTTMADAIVRSQAMFADTIAGYFVEDDHVRLELEIGSNDVGAFRNLLPDALYQSLDFGDAPLKERLPKFVAEDMPVLVGDTQLSGRITRIAPGPLTADAHTADTIRIYFHQGNRHFTSRHPLARHSSAAFSRDARIPEPSLTHWSSRTR